MDIKLIRVIAPPTPACFHDRLAWSEYLHSAQAHKVGKSRPFEGGLYQAGFNFCRDCLAGHRADMTRQSRCSYDAYVASLKTITHVKHSDDSLSTKDEAPGQCQLTKGL